MMHSIFLIPVYLKFEFQINCIFLLLDHSGKISKLELKKVLQALNIKANDNELQQLLSQMDTDNSGEVDFNEFKKVMGATFFKKYSKQELHAAFKKFDEDNNGYITTNELNHILTRMGRHISRADTEAMIKSLDASSGVARNFP